MTHTYAILRVPAAVFADIRDRLLAAGYGDQCEAEDGEVVRIDMHGIALEVGDD